MSFMDNAGGLGDKAKDFAGQNPDKVDQGVEQAGNFVDEKTGGQYADKVDQGQEALKNQFGGQGGDQQQGDQAADQQGGDQQQQ
ncbi:antitoxin [Calidifontibacter sp. DB0510]|uniref:Antitoxin n=1 Tax=Metallococcus carri TaxID=1656884 RepID=A0A967EA42_9MICO|nr:antitoxin [Metallococcus carri]NHN55489.1 antitoxin [Metallococcus carri]NOP38327.1 antitoxin [Calidifontibacter sp. DB2511S]